MKWSQLVLHQTLMTLMERNKTCPSPNYHQLLSILLFYFPIEDYSILEYILDIEHAVNVQEEN